MYNHYLNFPKKILSKGWTTVRCISSQTIVQQLPQLGSRLLDLRPCNVNVGTQAGQVRQIRRGRSGEIAELLERRSVDICTSLSPPKFPKHS